MKKLAMCLVIIAVALMYIRGYLITTGELPDWYKYILSGWQYFTEGIIK